ncbi:MSHA biogenesis protein MshP [Gammaproteobacteria bacterium]
MNLQRGFGAIAAIVILVILTILSSSIVSISILQQTTSAQDILSAKAWQAARAGNEWGLYKAIKEKTCSPSMTLDLVADIGFHVTVTCVSNSYKEGETYDETLKLFKSLTVIVYQIASVACLSNTCPATDASVADIGYIERRRVVMATD